MRSEEPHLPPGYRLDRSDPDVWTLRRPEGWVVAHFSVRGATKEAIEEAAWEDLEVTGEEEPVRKTHDYIHHYRDVPRKRKLC
jgi:hypothetical protein